VFCTGDYDRLRYEVLERYRDSDIPVTFGVLIADYDQRESQEFILNYLDRFHRRSGKLFDFFIPGYVSGYHSADMKRVKYGGKEYYWQKGLFDSFLEQFEKQFGIRYEYNPMLILMEHSNVEGYRGKRIIIDLCEEPHGVRKAGVLFDKIFSIAEEYVSIEEFSENLASMYMKGALTDTIVAALGIFDNGALSQLPERMSRARRYRLR